MPQFKNIITLIFCIFLAIMITPVFAQIDNPAYDKALADSLGADDYGMKKYILVILKTGNNTKADKKETDSLFRGHMDNINWLASTGQMIVAGPMAKNDKTYRGIFILDVPTIAEAEKLILTDPAVKADLLGAELYEWYGSAALKKYLPYHDKVEKKRF
jgi:uncharacterized protein